MIEKLFLSYMHKSISIEEKSLEDIADALKYIQGTPSLNKKTPELVINFAKELESKTAHYLDKLDSQFDLESQEKKESILNDLIKGDDLFSKTNKQVILNNSFAKIQTELAQIITQVTGKERVVIQSARECSTQVKEEIRTKYQTNGFVVFQINKSLLGGMKIYHEQKLIDSSWYGKILALKNLATNLK
jgi:F0F1-type ATP synthase delta subunit